MVLLRFRAVSGQNSHDRLHAGAVVGGFCGCSVRCLFECYFLVEIFRGKFSFLICVARNVLLQPFFPFLSLGLDCLRTIIFIFSILMDSTSNGQTSSRPLLSPTATVSLCLQFGRCFYVQGSLVHFIRVALSQAVATSSRHGQGDHR